MNMERSCGAVVFTRENGQIRYLLVQNLHGVYGFPKGHMEGTETQWETAAREIREETGLQIRFIEGFHTWDIYPSPRIEGWRKRVDYFLAEFEGQEYCLQASELLGGGLYLWTKPWIYCNMKVPGGFYGRQTDFYTQKPCHFPCNYAIMIR